MAYCAHCGAALQPGVRFCANCGTASAAAPAAGGYAPPANTPPGQPYAGAPAPHAAVARPDTALAETLILVGALLGAILPLGLALILLFFGALFNTLTFGWFPATFFGGLALIALLLGIVGAAAGLYARNLVREGQRERGGLLALVLGGVLCFTGNVFAGLALLGGGLLAYTAK